MELGLNKIELLIMLAKNKRMREAKNIPSCGICQDIVDAQTLTKHNMHETDWTGKSKPNILVLFDVDEP